MNTTNKKYTKKQTNAELQNRVDLVILLLAKGKKRSQILVDDDVCSWGMGQGSIDKYIKHAKNEIVGNSQQARTEHLGRAVLNLDYIYKESLDSAVGDAKASMLRLCLDCQKEKNKLLQLTDVYNPKTNDKVDEVMPADVRKLIDTVRIVNSPNKEDYIDEDYGQGLIVGSSK